MQKKIQLTIVICSLLMFSSIGNNINIGVAQEPTEDAPPYFGGRLFGTQLQIKQTDSEFFQDVDAQSNIVPQVKNGSTARFLTSLTNTGDESIFLKGIDVFLFNASEKRVTDISHQYVYYKELEIGKNSSLTVKFDRKLFFNLFDELFTVYYSVVFTASSNRTLDLYLSPSFNFTLLSVEDDAQPPEFVVWTWFLLSSLLVTYVIFGWWGNRKLKLPKN